METNLDRMRAIDLAWNERRWNDYGDLLADDLLAFASGDALPHKKREHIDRAKTFCNAFPDNRVYSTPYLELFASFDNRMTCSIARITGTMTGTMKLSGKMIKPTGRIFDTSFVAICRWQDGKIIEQREYFDVELMMAQLKIGSK